MIDVKEHVYHDDPKIGPADVRTALKEVSYFFLGNGLIQAVVQYSPQGEGTPLGLIIQNPEVLCKKRDTLTFDPDSGLKNTQLTVEFENRAQHGPPRDLTVNWVHKSEIPQVLAKWQKDGLEIREAFCCPSSDTPTLTREITFKNLSDRDKIFKLKTSTLQTSFSKQVSLRGQDEKKVILSYDFDPISNAVAITERGTLPKLDAVAYWKNIAILDFSNSLNEHLFSIASRQLPAVISQAGKIDASVWQYNREWVRDQTFIVFGMTVAGHHKLARKLLDRLIKEFVSDEGDCVDSGEKRDPQEVELDQNGILLFVLENYVSWTDDFEIVLENWQKIVKIAEFPLKEVFRHEASGMFCNCRDYWERHQAHGVEDGLELMYQFFPSIGLKSAANLARKMSKNTHAQRWENYAAQLREAVLHHPKYAMVNETGFIKRRNPDGTIVEAIVPREDSGLPDGVPLADKNRIHHLSPDASAVLPIVFEYIPADSEVANATLAQTELLWNQEWDIGGYGRVNVDSEADSGGPWPVASLIIAKANVESKNYGNVTKVLEWLNTLPGALSGSWFEMYGPRIAPPYAQLGILPWAWAEVLALFIHHIIGFQPKDNYLRFRPRAYPGMGNIQARLPFRNCTINIDIRQAPETAAIQFECDTKFHRPADDEILFPFTGSNISIAAIVP
ncbi:hypothetical protein MJD09_16205 [bacterium]|nr:hypothetical protein [bacterium]